MATISMMLVIVIMRMVVAMMMMTIKTAMVIILAMMMEVLARISLFARVWPLVVCVCVRVGVIYARM